MMNSPLTRQLAEKFAKRIRSAPDVSPAQLVEQAYALALSRAPTDVEKEQMIGFINNQAAAYGGSESGMEMAVADFCQTIFCLNEFIFVD
jgi:hypothetical protein